MHDHTIQRFWERNQAIVDGEMTTFQLACWTVAMNVIGLLALALLWVCSR